MNLRVRPYQVASVSVVSISSLERVASSDTYPSLDDDSYDVESGSSIRTHHDPELLKFLQLVQVNVHSLNVTQRAPSQTRVGEDENAYL